MNEQANITNHDSSDKSSADIESGSEEWWLKVEEKDKAWWLKMEKNIDEGMKKNFRSQMILIVTLMLSMVLISTLMAIIVRDWPK